MVQNSTRYDGSEIRLPFKEQGGPKAVGKWFSNKKEGVKGIKSETSENMMKKANIFDGFSLIVKKIQSFCLAYIS